MLHKKKEIRGNRLESEDTHTAVCGHIHSSMKTQVLTHTYRSASKEPVRPHALFNLLITPQYFQLFLLRRGQELNEYIKWRVRVSSRHRHRHGSVRYEAL
jgi:hypothetical protein